MLKRIIVVLLAVTHVGCRSMDVASEPVRDDVAAAERTVEFEPRPLTTRVKETAIDIVLLPVAIPGAILVATVMAVASTDWTPWSP